MQVGLALVTGQDFTNHVHFWVGYQGLDLFLGDDFTQVLGARFGA